MVYSNFTRIEELRDQFGLAITSAASLYPDTPEVAALPCSLIHLALALNINTENATVGGPVSCQ